MEDYPDKSFELTADPVNIDGPLIQYQETDWQFIKRLASYQETVIVPDVTMDNQIFAYGYPKVYGEKTLPDDIAYSSGKDIKAYYTDYDYNPNLIENEYTYFEVESYDELTFGDKVTFHNYEMYVGEVTIELKKGLLVYNATLVRQPTIRQNPIYNEKIQGNSIEGTVLAVQNQEIKLHLNIDQEQDEDTAYWYPFVPPTTDMLYLMPQIGTNVSLYIPGLKEQNAIITGCVRTNGAECEQTSDPSTRYLATEYGQEMKLAPGGIYFTAGRNDLVLTFDDEEGVTISSHKGILLEAEKEIIIDSKTKVTFSSPNQIKMITPTGGFSIENEIHFNNMKTIVDCADESELPLVEQPLMQEEKQSYVLNKPGTAEEPGIDWGSIVSSAKGAIAIIQWKEVIGGAAQFGGGFFQREVGVLMGQTGTLGGLISSGLDSVPCWGLVGLGAGVYVDGVNSMYAGGTRMYYGLLGKTDGEKNILKEKEGESIYNTTQLVIGAYSINHVVSAGLSKIPYGANGIAKIGCYLDEVTASGKSLVSHDLDLINLEETFRGILPKQDGPAVEEKG
ncbi:hypothetical protein SAMN05660742_1173 [Propionispira arboris]|uniref:Uncharacterized protein n=1 Tax=Propionispira arboris TaxID=84035 RepID=A0A1H7BL56_9FIRM|nr:hypothetical protein [Propionispira arboris]SEJ78463.1 hypothetical protein SAMN05660742_1173 [Propionispira arboris]